MLAVWEGIALRVSTGMDVFDGYMLRILEGYPVVKVS